jgi:hypothetical protein
METIAQLAEELVTNEPTTSIFRDKAFFYSEGGDCRFLSDAGT